MHGWRHLASWVAEARRLLKACSCLEVLEASMKAGLLSHGWSSLAGLSRHVLAPRCSRHAWLQPSFSSQCLCLEVLEACMIGGIMSHGCSRVGGLSNRDCASRWSRHVCLEASCLMGGRGSQASQSMFLFRLEVLEACMVGGILPHGWPRLAGFSRHVLVSRCSRHP